MTGRSWVTTLGVILVSTCAVAGFAATAEKKRQVHVFSSGTEGYHTFRIPALVATRNGTLLAICEGRKTSASDQGDVDLVLKRSIDGGRTWGPLELIYEEGATQKVTIGNPCPVLDADTGVIWLPFTRNNDDVLITSSRDDGKSWAQPKRITSLVKKVSWTWYATGPGVGIQLHRGPHRGRLVIPCDHRLASVSNRQESSRSHVIYSDDHGKTWLVGGTAVPRTNECAVIQRQDHSLLLNMRSFRGRNRRAVMQSLDGGKTWRGLYDDPALPEPVCQASMIRFPAPRVGEQDRILFANPASTTARHRMTVKISLDEGRTWPIRKLVYAGSAAYSTLAKVSDNHVGLLYERDKYRHITFYRFSVARLTAGKQIAPE